MYSGVIRNKMVFSIHLQNSLVGDLKFHISKNFIPPLSIYDDTHFQHCFFINTYGIFILPRCSIIKLKQIKTIYHVFDTLKFNNLFLNLEEKIYAALKILTKNNICIYFINFQNLKYNSKNIEYHTNLSKQAIIVFQILNSTLP